MKTAQNPLDLTHLKRNVEHIPSAQEKKTKPPNNPKPKKKPQTQKPQQQKTPTPSPLKPKPPLTL